MTNQISLSQNFSRITARGRLTTSKVLAVLWVFACWNFSFLFVFSSEQWRAASHAGAFNIQVEKTILKIISLLCMCRMESAIESRLFIQNVLLPTLGSFSSRLGRFLFSILSSTIVRCFRRTARRRCTFRDYQFIQSLFAPISPSRTLWKDSPSKVLGVNSSLLSLHKHDS